ncbi:MAG: AAA family ATPase [Candidatus Sungbacteria bacterium]|nr:AAA family ATPase [Candidatus Sungbacteria bacterium]
MKDLIILAGAPGSGKSTVGELLREEHGFPLIDFGWLRQGHLNNQWSNASQEEEQMAFENLIFTIKNYWQHGYRNLVVTDLQEDKVKALAEVFNQKNYVVVTLVISDDTELKRRVLGERDSGFKNTDEAIQWNTELKLRPLFPHEHRIDNTHNNPKKTVKEIADLINFSK